MAVHVRHEPIMLPAAVLEAMSTPAGKCPLCGLALGKRKGARLCSRCRPFEGLPRDSWGWCAGRHRQATTQRAGDRWLCLPCQLKAWRSLSANV